MVVDLIVLKFAYFRLVLVVLLNDKMRKRKLCYRRDNHAIPLQILIRRPIEFLQRDATQSAVMRQYVVLVVVRPSVCLFVCFLWAVPGYARVPFSPKF